MYVPATSLITFANGVQQQTLSFPIAVDAFLSFGAAFNITITNVTLSDPTGNVNLCIATYQFMMS